MSKTMRLPRHTFDFSKLFMATKSFIDSHNESQIELKSKLNANHRATAEMITRLYAKQLNNALALGDSLEELPGFRTYNSSMATLKGCTVRTIMNHKKRLKSAGFITAEINHGAMGVELLISEDVFSLGKQTQNYDFSESKKSIENIKNRGEVKNFHPLVHVQQEQKNINSSVDNKERRLTTPPDDVTFGTGTKQEHHRNTSGSTNKKNRKTKGGAEILRQNQETSGSIDSETGATTNTLVSASSKFGNPGIKPKVTRQSDTPDMSFLLGLVQQFWFYAKNILYPEMILSDVENEQILNLIRISVYKNFKHRGKGTIKDYKDSQKIFEKRIDMVAKWLDRSPHRWIPVPEVYFNPNNDRNGFNKTYKWYVKQEALKAAVRNDLILQKARKEWEDYGKGNGRYKQKSRLQLFEIQKKRISQIKDENLNREYHNLIHKYLQIQHLK
ncbi:hypothetical protein [Aquimarina aggregata]|nr:hypothetical protein [Aquimarina aggregata]